MTETPTILSETLSTKRKEFLHGIFTTALEGGIGYWSQCSEYRWMLNKDASDDTNTLHDDDIDNFRAVIHPTEDEKVWGVFDGDDDTAPLTIDLAVIHKGVRMFIGVIQGFIARVDGVWTFGDFPAAPEDHYYWRFVEANATDGDRGDYDADIADTVVQFGLFGEVIYA